MKPLITINESIVASDLDEAFLQFINEAAPRNFAPTADKIQKSIKNRKYVGIYYEEEGDTKSEVLSGFRLIEPLVFGKGYKSADGHISHKNEYYLRAYVIKESQKDRNKQIRKIHRKSVSKSQRVPYFRLFKFERITAWEELRFTITEQRDGYNSEDKMIAEILQSITFD